MVIETFIGESIHFKSVISKCTCGRNFIMYTAIETEKIRKIIASPHAKSLSGHKSFPILASFSWDSKRTETDPNNWQYMTTIRTSKQPAFLQNMGILHIFYLPSHTLSNIFILSFYLQQHFHFLRTINMLFFFGHEAIYLLVFLSEYRQSLFWLVIHFCFSYQRKTLII